MDIFRTRNLLAVSAFCVASFLINSGASAAGNDDDEMKLPDKFSDGFKKDDGKKTEKESRRTIKKRFFIDPVKDIPLEVIELYMQKRGVTFPAGARIWREGNYIYAENTALNLNKIQRILFNKRILFDMSEMRHPSGERRLKSINVPNINFKNESIIVVLKFLKAFSLQADRYKTGLNYLLLLNQEQQKKPPRVTIMMHNIKLNTALKYICDSANLKCRFTNNAAIIMSPDIKLSPSILLPPSADTALARKVQLMKIPAVEFEETPTYQALNLLRHAAKNADPDRRGVNFFISYKIKNNPDLPKITMECNNTSLMQLLQYICLVANLRMSIDKRAIIVEPAKTTETKEKRK